MTGTLASGTIRVEDGLELLPAGRAARVRGLHVHGAPVRAAVAGQRAAVNLGDTPVAAVTRGDVLTTPGAFEATRRFDARIDLLPDAPALRHGARVRVHHGTTEAMGRVSLARVLGGQSSEVTGLPAGGRAHARVRVERPLVASRGDRFVLRSYSPMRTIGGGMVLDPAPRRGPVRSAAARERFEAIDPGESPAAGSEALQATVLALVTDYGREGVRPRDLARRLGLDPGSVLTAGGVLTGAGGLVSLGDCWMTSAIVEQLHRELEELVSAHHHAQADSEGLPREEARDRLRVATGVFDGLVESLTSRGRLAGRDRLALPGRQGQVPDADRDLFMRVEQALQGAGLKPPDEAELATALATGMTEVGRALSWLGRQRRTTRLGGLAFHTNALEQLKREVRALGEASMPGTPRPRLDVAAFKARYDVSRKYAIPLLEYLDRERVTRRVGDVREVL